jgi:hypothetical protein
MAQLYKLSDKCSLCYVEVQNKETGLWTKEAQLAVFPFGLISPITNEKLTDEIAEWLLAKADYQEGGENFGKVVKKQADKITKIK